MGGIVRMLATLAKGRSPPTEIRLDFATCRQCGKHSCCCAPVALAKALVIIPQFVLNNRRGLVRREMQYRNVRHE